MLVRAGLPLEQHLADAGRGHGQRLQQLTESIVNGLQQGHSLEQLIEQDTGGESKMLASAVAAGVRSGNLGATIEMMGDFAADLVSLRRQVLQAMVYPLTVVVVAWCLFALVIQHTLTRILTATEQLGINLHPVLLYLLQLNARHPEWLWVVPAVCLLLAALWLLSGRAATMAFRGPERLLLWLPGVRTLVRDLQFYTLARMLSLMVDRSIPLPEALILAGATCGSPDLEAASRSLARQLREGQRPEHQAGRGWTRRQFPPLLQACLRQTATDEQRFSLRLKAVTDYYRERLGFHTAWLKTVLPVALFVVIGGGAAAIYAASVFWPVLEIYRQLSDMS